jgi:hypothetical protein
VRLAITTGLIASIIMTKMMTSSSSPCPRSAGVSSIVVAEVTAMARRALSRSNQTHTARVTRCGIGPDAAGPITLARVAGPE